MERKHFVTTAQTVLTRVISITVKKVIQDKKTTSYKYLLIKLPVTFKNQTVTFWDDKKGYGGKAIAIGFGGSAMIKFSDELIEEKSIVLGDIMTATFKDKEAVLE